jgi:hypothetical protein
MREMNMIEVVNPSSLRVNIWCAIFQPLTQHMLIARNNRETNIQLQTSRNFNRVKQNMLLILKTIHAQHCCASKGKMKVKKVVNKSMMNDLVWVKRQSFLNATMSSFCYQNPKQISGVGVAMKTSEFNEKIHDNNAKLKKV